MNMLFKKFLLSLSILFFVLSPAISFAQGDTGITFECVEKVDGKDVYGNCTFANLLEAIQKVFRKVIPLAIAFSVIVIARVGYLYMISGENPGKRKEANSMLVKVAMGIFFMAAAWMIVTLILNSLTDVCPPGTVGEDCIPALLN